MTAPHQVAKLRVALLGALLCCSAGLQLERVNCFLYHQLQPASNSAHFYATNYSVHLHRPARQQPQPQVPPPDSRQQPALALDEPADSCPARCKCDAAGLVDCSNRNLQRVPASFPRDTKRIKLERNNLTELPAFAFRGLQRLQRIDLSNNNLARLDPLAFAGGLQALSSLILYSNKLSQLPANLFEGLNQLTLLLLNANSLQCIHRDQFHSLANLNLLSLYDNNIETLANGTFESLRSIKTIHLGKNPLHCDCSLKWLANYLEQNPSVETSEAKCASPPRRQARKLAHLARAEFTCEVNEAVRTNQCSAAQPQQQQQPDQSCPAGCVCSGSTVDCSLVSQSESRAAGGLYELPDIPDDIPVYVARMKISDNRVKRIRQTGLFRRLANSQKLDLGNNKIVDIEDNSINGAGVGGTKPERVVFVLLENELCSGGQTASSPPSTTEDPCSAAPRINAPTYDSPCYNGGSCKSNSGLTSFNYSCLCPPGFAGPLCELNIDDCAEHQCQNGAMCVDGVNSYRCVCRDPTTSGEFCEQLNPPASNAASSIAPVALPMISASGPAPAFASYEQQPPANYRQTQQILTRSADFLPVASERDQQSTALLVPATKSSGCKRVTQRRYYDDGNGCQSVRVLKMSECLGGCSSASGLSCCTPAKVKRRRIRMQCSDGASYVKSVDLVKKCACSSDCASLNDIHQNQRQVFANSFNATQEDQIMQITRLDAVE